MIQEMLTTYLQTAYLTSMKYLLSGALFCSAGLNEAVPEKERADA